MASQSAEGGQKFPIGGKFYKPLFIYQSVCREVGGHLLNRQILGKGYETTLDISLDHHAGDPRRRHGLGKPVSPALMRPAAGLERVKEKKEISMKTASAG